MGKIRLWVILASILVVGGGSAILLHVYSPGDPAPAAPFAPDGSSTTNAEHQAPAKAGDQLSVGRITQAPRAIRSPEEILSAVATSRDELKSRAVELVPGDSGPPASVKTVREVDRESIVSSRKQ